MASFIDRVWSRTTLLARLTMAGIAAAVVLALVFGFGMAHIQKVSALKREQERSLRAAVKTLLSLDRDVFSAPMPATAADFDRVVTSKAKDLAELVDADGIAVLEASGRKK